MKTPAAFIAVMKESPKYHFFDGPEQRALASNEQVNSEQQLDTTCVADFENQTVCETNADCQGALPGCVHCAYYEVNGKVVDDEERICINSDYCDYDFTDWNLFEEGDSVFVRCGSEDERE